MYAKFRFQLNNFKYILSLTAPCCFKELKLSKMINKLSAHSFLLAYFVEYTYDSEENSKCKF